MTAMNRWPAIVLAVSLLLIVIGVVSKSWVLGEDEVRAGLWSQDWAGHSDRYGAPDVFSEMHTMGMITAILSVSSALGLVVLIAQVWMQSNFSTVRAMTIVGLTLQIVAALVVVNAKVGDLYTWSGPAFTVYLVGSMGALVGAAALPPRAA